MTYVIARMIVSIDVGIRHLSFCKLQTDADGNIDIKNWDVIDLSQENKQPKCCQKMKTKVCGKNATWTHANKTFYCGTHAKTCGIEKAPDSYVKVRDKKRPSKKDIAGLGEEYTISKTSQFQSLDDVREHIYNNKLTPMKKRNSASECNLVDVGVAISHRLPDAIGLEGVNKILIENQIGPLAIRMKCVQGMLTQFFIEHDITDITFISSSNKLKHFDLPKKNYKERKASGILATSNIINSSDKLRSWNAHFAKHKKKDDLADSFLQGLWYIKHST